MTDVELRRESAPDPAGRSVVGSNQRRLHPPSGYSDRYSQESRYRTTRVIRRQLSRHTDNCESECWWLSLRWRTRSWRSTAGRVCLMGSVSGYDDTPVRPVFIGMMLVIGIALVVIKGRTAFEDACFSIAGLMAPVVAFIPTSDDLGGACRAQMLAIGHYQPSDYSGFIPASINNNLHALVLAGAVTIVLLLVAKGIERLPQGLAAGLHYRVEDQSRSWYRTCRGRLGLAPLVLQLGSPGPCVGRLCRVRVPRRCRYRQLRGGSGGTCCHQIPSGMRRPTGSSGPRW